MMLIRGLAVAMVLVASLAGAQTPTPVPTSWCAPVVLTFTQQGTCDAHALGVAPCSVHCGRFCWRAGRKIWEWLQDAKGCPQFPMPTPTPGPMACNPPACRTWGTGVCINPCPYQTPTPVPTKTMSLLPTPTPAGKTPCDRGEPNWCLTWSPESDTVICARCR